MARPPNAPRQPAKDQPTYPRGAWPVRTAVVVSEYNAPITDLLVVGAMEAFTLAGGHKRDLEIYQAPGAFELVALTAAAARSGRFKAVVALGCIVKGETRHDEFLGHAVTNGLAQVSASSGVAIGLGVLTVNTQAQAVARAGGRKGSLDAASNKGAEAMLAALYTARVLREITGEDSPLPDLATELTRIGAGTEATNGSARGAPGKPARRSR